jgi:glucose/arabinose dehydrogenase
MVFKVKGMSKLVISAGLIGALLVPSNQTAVALGQIKLDVRSVDTPAFLVQGDNGQRGAALAQLSDGRLLIGGGKNGFTLFLYDAASNTQTLLGQVAGASERLNDSRFAVTDIAVLSELNNDISLLISYPQYQRSKRCVSVVMNQYQLNLGTSPTLTKGKLWFASKPCVPVSAVQHAAGRIEVIDKTSAYLTVGDLGFTRIANRSARGDLGSVFKVSAGSATKSKVERISQGHRNQQGIVLVGNDLYVSEHGPRGGDELNLISKGRDYGWPAVTYGEPYSSGDYVRPRTTGSHEGFTKPLYNWVPSVAPTELIQLPTGNSWGPWAGQLVMGTLREESLVFIQLRSRSSVGEVIKVDVNERIRDLEMGKNNQIIATTDTGQLLFISMAK